MKEGKWSSLVETGEDPLCCCEYMDSRGERSHILLCCCDCEALDDLFDRMFTGRKVTREHREHVCQVVQERLRIPWWGGARRVPLDVVLPPFMLPTFLMLACMGPFCTAISFTLLPAVILCLHRHSLKFLPRSRFYLSWTISTGVYLLGLFQYKVVPYLEILPEENGLLIVMFLAASLFAFLTRMNAKVQPTNLSSESGSNGFYSQLDTGAPQESLKPMSSRMYPCRTCQGNVEQRDHHCVWLDCCVGQSNHGAFLLAVILFIACALFGATLILTSVCRPTIVWNLIYLPQDCNDVYESVDLSLPFVSAVYAVAVALLLVVLFLQQVILISLGVTGCEWRRLHRQHGFLAACRAVWLARGSRNRRGILANWRAFIIRRFVCGTL